MNDNKTLKDIIIEVTEQEIEENCPELSASPEEMMAKIANKERARKKKCLGYIAVAAVLILAFVVIGIKFGDSILHVDADKNGKEIIMTDEGVLIEDKGWGSSSEEGIIITDWQEIAIAKTHVENLLVPEYIPEGYEFEELNIDASKERVLCVYSFEGERKPLEIYMLIGYEKMASLKTEKINDVILSSKGDVYIRNSNENKIATILIDDGITIEVHSDESCSELVEIIENMN